MQRHTKIVALVAEDGAQLDNVDAGEAAQGLQAQAEIGQSGKGSGAFKTFATALGEVSWMRG